MAINNKQTITIHCSIKEDCWTISCSSLCAVFISSSEPTCPSVTITVNINTIMNMCAKFSIIGIIVTFNVKYFFIIWCINVCIKHYIHIEVSIFKNVVIHIVIVICVSWTNWIIIICVKCRRIKCNFINNSLPFSINCHFKLIICSIFNPITFTILRSECITIFICVWKCLFKIFKFIKCKCWIWISKYKLIE